MSCCDHHDSTPNSGSKTPRAAQGDVPPTVLADRRSFVKAGGLALSAAALSPRLFAEAKAAVSPRRTLSHPVMVVIFQRGGADGLQLFAPTGDPNYAQLRPTVGIGAPGSTAAVQGLFMTPLFSMHPSLAGLHALYSAAQSRLAVVHAAGYVPYHRSHFESQDLFETGSFAGLSTSGWINRHLSATAGVSTSPVRGLAIRQGLPRSMAGPFPCYAVNTITDLAFLGTLPDVRSTLEYITDYTVTSSMQAGRQTAYQGMKDTFDLIDFFGGINPNTYVPLNGAVYPVTDLGNRLKQVAQLIRADRGIEVFQVDQGGWDHHTNIVLNINTYGTQISQAVAAFYQDLGPVMSEVVVMAYTEFGREGGENGSAGCDHGAGGSMIVAGGAVQGGQLHGAWPTVATAALAEGRFLAPVNDFRDVITEILMDHMGGTNLNSIFSNYTYAPIGVI